MKKKVIFLVLLSMLFATTSFAGSMHGEYNGDEIVRVTSNGNDLSVQDVPAIIHSNRTLVPVYLLRQLGAQVTWDSNTYTVDVSLPKQLGVKDIYDKFGSAIASAQLSVDNAGKTSLLINTTLDFSQSGSSTTYTQILNFVQSYDVSEVTISYSGGKITLKISDIRDFDSGKISGDELNKRAVSTRTPLTAKDVASLVDRVGVVYIFDANNKLLGQGSGFMIDSGIFITNYHVGAAGNGMQIYLDNQVYNTFGEYLFKNQATDVFGVYIGTGKEANGNVTGLPQKRLPYSTKLPQVGDKVYAIGSPKGYDNTVSDGIVSAVRTINGVTMIQHTANTTHGSSGGVLLNEYGEVIGITSAGVDGTDLDFAVPMMYVQQEIDKLVKK